MLTPSVTFFVDARIADSEVTLRRRWSHLHSLAVTGLVLVPEHNFLLSMGNDGACRVLDYLQVSGVATAGQFVPPVICNASLLLRGHARLIQENASPGVHVPRRTHRMPDIPLALDTSIFFVATIVREARS